MAQNHNVNISSVKQVCVAVKVQGGQLPFGFKKARIGVCQEAASVLLFLPPSFGILNRPIDHNGIHSQAACRLRLQIH